MEEQRGYAAGWTFDVKSNQFNTKRLAAPTPGEFKVYFQVPPETLQQYALGNMSQPFLISVLNGMGDVQIETEASQGANADSTQTTEVSQFLYSQLPLVGACLPASGQIIIPQIFHKFEADLGTKQPKLKLGITLGNPRRRWKTVTKAFSADTQDFIQIPPHSQTVSIWNEKTDGDLGITVSSFIFAGPATNVTSVLTMILPKDLTKQEPIPWNATKIYLTTTENCTVRFKFEREL